MNNQQEADTLKLLLTEIHGIVSQAIHADQQENGNGPMHSDLKTRACHAIYTLTDAALNIPQFIGENSMTSTIPKSTRVFTPNKLELVWKLSCAVSLYLLGLVLISGIDRIVTPLTGSFEYFIFKGIFSLMYLMVSSMFFSYVYEKFKTK